MGSSAWPLQQGIYAQLSDNAPLMSIVTGVFDQVPMNKPYPYITIGSIVEVSQNGFTDRMTEYTVFIHVWSQQPGFKECEQIHDHVVGLLHRQSLTLPDGYVAILSEFETSNIMKDPDGLTRHLISQYRIMVE